MTHVFGNNGEETVGRREKTLFQRKPLSGSPPLLPLNLLPLSLVIPNSANHYLTDFDLILHRLAEEGSPYLVQKNYYLVFQSFLFLLKLSINPDSFDPGYALICFSLKLPHKFLRTIHNTQVHQY